MDITSVIGLILGIIAIGIGMVLKGVGLGALVNPAAILIILLGTIAAVTIAFPMNTLKKVPALLKILFTENKQTDNKELIQTFGEMADQTRKEGLLSLESQLTNMDDPFIKSGIELVVDGQSPDYIKEVLIEKIDAMEARHEEGAAIFTQAGTYAPTLGVLGAVIGLIAALGDMTDIEKLGHAISAAFVATLLGIFTGYVLWHPFANKLREKSKQEIRQKELIVEGILSVANGNSAMMVRDKLGAFIATKELAELKKENNQREDHDA
ncbi:flagellar motor protein MotA [Bacilli bacterium]|uniref:flagellar motor stator protein MotA n=1 Tax=Oceanobacillus caeni TaxID=405946 RepID=UPI00062221DC|nr:flagellar motor protein MotA [Bacilli bacterium VT-13-104]PZD83255.1 flagellar motor protein MotA [Bacilli bacterium]PZD86119.1 flagellar motor protein MotA [Bacilli bacterium]PZD90291.1 flagellar motor protein MotA [Bacilli bacterium]RCO06074.1 flagellar motor protein MotA [Bacilli bacterium]